MNDIFTFVGEQWLLVGVLIALVYLYAWRERLKNGQPVTTSEATVLINAGTAQFVDVRDASEFKAGHITGALNIPFSKLAEQADSLEEHREKTLILVDKMGQHAGSAGRQLGAKGYKVCRLSGGISEWQNQNLPLIKK
ncbi:rhodanese-like domain-containing protein [Gilvimarinus sp. SDUM040013]|uniref:Rhodanese-like domain-containing protein n=1 Tax=Gilvimarinus gilvus TaxID=3058038 RepID=A0ABU4RUM7_9GAMM|nr:rhodanese-like domain-containing protein [Gilvimarinus sp. SDUM040013]MDO3388550.1 rhodanese-like domain-containing protein [Gilvimarinus sp. SDUM040013]MDX6848578.1 rhodanese-like domain-containing protein [Gilvimarinus sp. SDUM040013]